MEQSRKITKIKNIIDSIFNDINHSSDLNLVKLKNKWEYIVGQELFKYTKPQKIQGNKLYILCNHQGWINTLQFHKKRILENILKNFENEINIEDIIFHYGKI